MKFYILIFCLSLFSSCYTYNSTILFKFNTQLKQTIILKKHKCTNGNLLMYVKNRKYKSKRIINLQDSISIIKVIDLDSNNLDEFYFFSSDKDSLSMKFLSAFEINSKNLIIPINYSSDITTNDFLKMYAGNDKFKFDNGFFIRKFSILDSTDINNDIGYGEVSIYYQLKNTSLIIHHQDAFMIK